MDIRILFRFPTDIHVIYETPFIPLQMRWWSSPETAWVTIGFIVIGMIVIAGVLIESLGTPASRLDPLIDFLSSKMRLGALIFLVAIFDRPEAYSSDLIAGIVLVANWLLPAVTLALLYLHAKKYMGTVSALGSNRVM